jgi:hypothetical protein
MQQQPPFVQVEPGIYAWQFNYGEQLWRQPLSLMAVLCDKKRLIEKIKDLNYQSYDALQRAFALTSVDMHSIGLCYEQAKLVPVELTPKG